VVLAPEHRGVLSHGRARSAVVVGVVLDPDDHELRDRREVAER
jgi:hypothetical protein